MTAESRFVTYFREEDTDHAGLVLEDDGTVWIVNPDGTRSRLTGAGGLPVWWTVDNTPGAESVSIEPTGDGAPFQVRVKAGAGSKDDITEILTIENDEGERLFGIDGTGQIGADLYETEAFKPNTVFSVHPADDPFAQLPLFTLSTGAAGQEAPEGGNGGAKMTAGSPATPARICALFPPPFVSPDVVRVEDDARLGFFGKEPVARPAAPVTLDDVIAALKALGLVAS